MKKTVKYILILLCVCLLFAAAYFTYDILKDRYSPEPGPNAAGNTDTAFSADTDFTDPSVLSPGTNPAPVFTVTDGNGNPVSLSDFSGQPVVINFFATWCSPCKAELPDFNSLAEEYGDDVVFMIINLTGSEESMDAVKTFARDNGYTFPLYFDTDGTAAAAYSIYSIPETLFIDRKGNIVSQQIGMMSEPAIRAGIESLIN